MKNFKKFFVVVLAVSMLLVGAVTVSAADPVNVASKATATASTFFSEAWNPGNAIDGNMETSWAAAGENNPWIELELEKETDIAKIVLYGRAAGTNPEVDKIYELDISIDGKVVKTIADYPADSYENPVVITFDTPVKGKKVMFEVIDGIANPGFAEIQIYETTSGGNPTTAPTRAPETGNDQTPATGDASALLYIALAGASVFGGLKLRKK